jgi:glycosyltransferase involved in cell wall biosynthesis
MALSTAVLTSTGGALPEVAGEAAVIVDPYDVQAITNGIRMLDADADLRGGLERLGLAQAKKFSPEAYRIRLNALYAKVGLSA